MADKDKTWEEKLQQTIAAKEKEFAEKDQQQQIELFKRDLKAHVASKKDEFEFVNAHPDGLDLVFDVIFTDLQRKQEAGETGAAPMDYDTAASKVEAFLDAEASKYLSLNKVKSKFQEQKPDLSAYLRQEEPKTITPSMAPKSAMDASQLSDEDRIKLAVEGIKTGKWNLA
jgi:hypothetical protein